MNIRTHVGHFVAALAIAATPITLLVVGTQPAEASEVTPAPTATATPAPTLPTCTSISAPNCQGTFVNRYTGDTVGGAPLAYRSLNGGPMLRFIPEWWTASQLQSWRTAGQIWMTERDKAEQRVAVLEPRLDRKNATIAKLRAKLRAAS